MILAALPMPLIATMALLPLVGLMLNGTSSVLYGTVPEFVTAEKRTHAFAVFYTGGSIAGAAAPILFGILGDHIGLMAALSCVAALALLTVPMVWALRPALVLSGAKDLPR
jgi:predicted MFS family arabinose efflux permease